MTENINKLKTTVRAYEKGFEQTFIIHHHS